ncbi:MAG: hypothetical protein U0Z26_06415 [Anaerolineales bacterium]
MNHVFQKISEFKIKIEPKQWHEQESELLLNAITLFATILGGQENFIHHIGEIKIEKTDTGTSLGLAYIDHIKFNSKAHLSTWSVLHELSHIWDAKNKWNLSVEFEKFTGGFTDKVRSLTQIGIPELWDAGPDGALPQAGYYGRKPGCNAEGYFYGDQPSGSNWRFNRKEDFAESVVMYCGWGRKNILSKTAHGRIERYLLPDGQKDPLYGIVDLWSSYAKYFYPSHGDYTKTKRWQFVDTLINDHPQLGDKK